MSVIDDSWDFCANIQKVEKDFYEHFEQKVFNVQDNIIQLLEDSFKINRIVFHGSIDPDNHEELQSLINTNKQLRHDIDLKLRELGKQQIKYETYKKDQKLLSQEIKETHEAFLMAKKFYKKFLKTYFSIESRANGKQTIFIQFFTESKKDSDNYSVRLHRDMKSGHYELLSTIPKVNSHKELQRRLGDTNDVPEVLCCIRQAFIAIKANKK